LDDLFETIVASLTKNIGGEIIAGVGVIAAILYKMYRIIKADRREDTLSEEQEAFRRDLIKQLTELREENVKLHNKTSQIQGSLFRSETNLRNIRLNMQVFKVVLRNKTTDDNLIALFNNIACFNQVVDEASLRNFGLSQTTSNRIISSITPENISDII